ncbi:MAG: hypothetical protein KC609_10350 [Myxococcales bacterium]|nr:hypothetical protein [Myxococcales bacterium]
MQRTRRFEFGTFIVVLVVVCGSLVACGGSKASSNGTTDAAIDGSGGADAADASVQSPDADGFVGGFDVSGPDTAMEDATSDTATADTMPGDLTSEDSGNGDAPLGDTSLGDSASPDDSGVGDTNVDDLSLADTSDDTTPSDVVADLTIVPDLASGPDAVAGLTVELRVRYDVGQGNSIVLRGDGPGLSWDADKPCVLGGGSLWVCSVGGVTQPFKFKPVFRYGNGDIVWPEGPDWIAPADPKGLDLQPFYFNKKGTLTSISVSSAIYGKSRTVRIYLPPSFNEPGAAAYSYPILFMFDGQNLFGGGGTWQLESALDELLTYGKHNNVLLGGVREMVVVAPEHGGVDRIYEYTPVNGSYDGCNASVQTCGGGGDDTLDFILGEVLPAVQKKYAGRLLPGRFGIAGSSLGGLMSLYACWTRTESFERCGIFSPSLSWSNSYIVKLVKDYVAPKKQLEIYLDASETQDNTTLLGSLYDDLISRSGANAYKVDDDLFCLIGLGQGHNEGSWAIRAPFAMHNLYRDPHRVQVVPVPLESNLVRCGN